MKFTISEESKKKLSEGAQQLALEFQGILPKLNNYKNSIEKPRGLDVSASGVIKAEQAKQAFEQFKNSSISGSLNFGAALVLKDYQINFQFVTDPQLRTAANSMGGYFNILAQGVIQQERLKQQYRVMMVNSILNMGTQAASLALMGRMPGFGIGGLTKRMGLNALGRMALQRLGIGIGLAKISAGISVVISLLMLGYEIFKFISESEKLKEITEIANKSALIQLFNPQPLLQIYNNNTFLLGTEVQRRGTPGSGMEMLVGTEFEDSLAGEEPQGVYSLVSRVYESAFTGSYSRTIAGFDVRGFGFDTAKIMSLASNLERNTQTGYNEGVIANILTISGIYAGGDTSEMEKIMQNIIRSNAFTSDDVNEATEKFEEFFSAVVGDGKPQAAHLKLLSSLAAFSTQYAMGTRANIGGSTQIAKIQQFMADSGAVNERFDTAPLKTAITTIDNLLLQGATYKNLGSVQIFNSLGLTREEAIRGVTADAMVFEKFISGMFQYLNVTGDDVLGNSRNFDVSLQNFAQMTGLSANELQTIVVSMRRYASGHRIDEIRQGYSDNIRQDVDVRLEYAQGGLNAAGNFFEILSNITYSSNKLISVVEKNLDVIRLVQDMNSQIVTRGFNDFANAFVSLFTTVVGVQQLRGTFTIPGSFGPITNPYGVSPSTRPLTTSTTTPVVTPGTPGSSTPSSTAAQGLPVETSTTSGVQVETTTRTGAPVTVETSQAAPSVTTSSTQTSGEVVARTYPNILLSLIDRTESTADYDALFAYSNRAGMPWQDVKVTEMTIDEVLNFQNPKGDYAQWVLKNNPYKLLSSPAGRYQFVGSTLADLVTRYGIEGTRLFNKQTQDELFLLYLANRMNPRFMDDLQKAGAFREFELKFNETGTFGLLDKKRENLRLAWQGLREVSDEEVDAAVIQLEEYLQNRATGGLVFPSSSQTQKSALVKKPKQMQISIPLFSMSPHMSANKFVDYMASYLNS